jgi:anaerobic dimethyl sulfoxide reductase subunit C (anchor subunit)
MAPPDASARLGTLAFLGFAAIAAIVSTLHLGQKFRAYRAILNWRNSWLSREVLLFSAFVGFSLIHLMGAPLGALTGWLAAIMGFATLIAIDHVYAVTATTHSSPQLSYCFSLSEIRPSSLEWAL